MDNNVPILFLDEYEELELFDTTGYSVSPSSLGCPTHSVSTFEHLCKLSAIADRILCNLYVEKSLEKDPEELFRASKSIHADLIRWRQSLPTHLSILFDISDSKNNSDGCIALPHTLALL